LFSPVRVSLVLALAVTAPIARAQPTPPLPPLPEPAPAVEPSGREAAPRSAVAPPAAPSEGTAPPEVPAADASGRVYETKVEGLAPTTAASAESIRDRDLQLRPIATPEDILRVVPGLVIAQHQGGGKADQLFLRGFDADHGTDVALAVDGIPVNLPSHAHGQGYADLNFLIPETVDRVDVTKGPYFVETGDFATAGAVNLRTRRSFEESSVQGSYGSFDTWRALGIASLRTESPTWFAAEVAGTQGPFLVGEDLIRYNLMARSSFQVGASTRLTLLGSAYGSQWRASGQIPQRLVDLPESDPAHLDRFGSIDPTEGGQTQRQMIALTLDSRPSDTDQLSLTAYVVRYRLSLFNDFTFQLRDQANFDEIEQDDARVYGGLNALYRKRLDLGDVRSVVTLGAQARLDSISNSLWHVKQRVRLPACAPVGQVPLNPCASDDIVQSDLAAFAQEDLRFGRYLRVLFGVRADLFEWNVTNTDPNPNPDPLPSGGTAAVQKAIVNPKLQVVVSPLDSWDLYLDGGGGFHSNDARAIVADGGSGALPRAWGAEVGSRLSLLDHRLDLGAALWFIHLQSELVFVADDGTFEAAGPTDRYGVDLEARFRILPWMWADADLTLAHAAFTQNPENESAVALAPTFTGQAGLSVLHPSGFRGRLGGRWVGGRPATQDPNGLRAQGYFIVDATLAYRWRFLELGLIVQNLLNSEWREAQFANQSYVVGRDPPVPPNAYPPTDIHFTPGNPFGVRGTVTVFF
jgi:outer membrane receptor protein involved in Fe transport